MQGRFLDDLAGQIDGVKPIPVEVSDTLLLRDGTPARARIVAIGDTPPEETLAGAMSRFHGERAVVRQCPGLKPALEAAHAVRALSASLRRS